MKKLRLNNIFHWLYAFLMFCPIFTFLGQYLVAFGTGDFTRVTPVFENIIPDAIGVSFESGISHQIFMAFDTLISDIFGISQFTDGFNSLFTYWVMISLIWLCFDVLMFLINLAHRWIDRGTDL